ncbi:MAG: hypothetical protein HUU35_01575 [Armatimonadetes bacterium]|nr:hypothetical protein [Armatimonadota bacterium]
MLPRVDRLFRRHVHLDFHTSELIENIGGAFSRGNWQAALRAGRLDGITVFAKCHHSWCYYPSAVGSPHPHLQLDLLGEQLAASHELGVIAPIYITVGWSATDAEQHPDWLQRNQDGSPAVANFDLNASPETPRPVCSWKFLCPSGGYRDHIVALTQEIAERYRVDGLFYDICGQGPCFCDNCRAGMAAAGLDIERADDCHEYNIRRWTGFMDECNATLHARHPNAPVFYNGNANLQRDPRIWERLTHFELEDLPTTWGGYDKLPLRAKFFMQRDKPRCSMSGKFHTSWGEFGGFKHPDAMRFEGAAMIAFGTGASFGDQVHPDGAMELATYQGIGEAYEYLEQIEELGLGDAESCASLGLVVSRVERHDQGVANMLLETQTDFEVVAAGDDLTRFETLVLPGARIDQATAEAVNAFVAGGGALLVLGEGALDLAGERFLLDVGATYQGAGRYDLDYLLPTGDLAAELPDSPFLCYAPAVRCALTDGEALATVYEPYFSRTYGHFCSHQNTPYQRTPASHPGAVRKGQVIFLPHALGSLYHHHGARVHRQLFANALGLLHRRPVLDVELPSAGRVNLIHQPSRRRYVAHLLYGPPLQRGRCSVIEDLVPLHEVAVGLRVPETIGQVKLAPQGTILEATQASGQVRVVVPELSCHQAVVFEY